MADFLAMDGYGGYIWPAYGASAAVIAALAFSIWRRGRVLRKRLAEHEARQNKKPDHDES